jgi:hypothetical protein
MCLIPFFIVIAILIIPTISIHVFFSSISSQKGDYNRTQIVPEKKGIEKNTESKRCRQKIDADASHWRMSRGTWYNKKHSKKT